MTRESETVSVWHGSPMRYFGRQSISPVIAGLFSGGLIAKSQAVLDARCGDGFDRLTL